jgi:excisionase family DNA binding protein
MLKNIAPKLDLIAAGQAIGTSPHTLRMWARRGLIPHYRIGRKIMFDPEDLARFLASRRIGA